MSRLGTVMVVGSINLDTTLCVPHIPIAGETILSSCRTTAPGGKGANQAVAATAAGASVRLTAAVGSDDEARLACENLLELGTDLSAVHVNEHARTGSAVLVVATDEDAENTIIVDASANALLEPRQVSRSLAANPCRVVLTQLEIPLAAVRVCGEDRQAEFRILNPAPFLPEPELHEVLKQFNVLVPNRTELAQLVGRAVPHSIESVTECVRALEFPGVVVVTLGADGAALFGASADLVVEIRPPEVTPVDTTGAGDAFCGVLACELANGRSLVDSVRRAVYEAARSTEQAGAQLTSRIAERS